MALKRSDTSASFWMAATERIQRNRAQELARERRNLNLPMDLRAPINRLAACLAGACHGKPATLVPRSAPCPPVRAPLKNNFPALISPLKLLALGWLVVMAVAAPAAPDATRPAPIGGLEKAVLDELNVARTAPLKYVEYLKDRRSRFKGNSYIGTPGVRVITREGVAAVDEAIAALSKQQPLAALKFSEGLALAARDHVQDTGPKGLVSHDGSDGSDSAARISRYGKVENVSGECISYGHNQARQIVLTLIIDDGVASRGHRRNIYNGAFRLAGIACGPHQTFKNMCVIDFAAAYKEDPQAILERQTQTSR